MNTAIVEHVFENSNLSALEKLTALAILKYAKRDGTGAFPSLRTLSRVTGLCLAEVCMLIPKLETKGAIQVRRRQGPKGGNVYDVLWNGALRDGAPRDGARSPGALADGPELKTEKTFQHVLSHGMEHNGVECQEVEHPPISAEDVTSMRQWFSEKSAVFREVVGEVRGGGGGPQAEVGRAAVEEPMEQEQHGGVKTYLGRLCKRSHDYQGTGQTLRVLPSQICMQCRIIDQRQQRAGRRTG